MGDFNAKMGIQRSGESYNGPLGMGNRNQKGQLLANILESQGMLIFSLKISPKRRWTWRNPDRVAKNEIDFNNANERRTFSDVSVINRFNIGSDHRLVRATLNINLKAKSMLMIKFTLPPSAFYVTNRFERSRPSSKTKPEIRSIATVPWFRLDVLWM